MSPNPTKPAGRALKVEFGRGALVAFAVLACAGFLSICEFQLVHLRGSVSTDEYFFSACAVRGLANHLIPVFGCHDNKGPVIFLIYELIFAAFGVYNYLATKIVVYLIGAAYTTLLARCVFRMSGWPGALTTTGLTLLCLSSDYLNLALRTELVGALFLAMGLVQLSGADSRHSLNALSLSGLFFGAAIVTKQPFAFAALGVTVWLILEERPTTWPHALRVLRLVSVFALSALLPFIVFLLIFQFQGTAKPFLVSMFLYPLVYGGNHPVSLADWVRRVLSLVAAFNFNAALLSGAVASGVALAFRSLQFEPPQNGQLSVLRLNAVVAAFLLFFLIISPLWWPYYIVGLSAPLLILVGSVTGHVWQRLEKDMPEALPSFGAGMASMALILAAHTWMSNGDYKRAENSLPASVLQGSASGTRYAFQLGVQPDLYAAGHFVPASSVLFLWALPGTPSTLVFTRPSADSLVGRALERVEAENQEALLEDFRRTPPSLVLLQSNWVRSTNSANVVDIPLLRSYLQLHCKQSAQNPSNGNVTLFLYRCAEPATSSRN